MFSLTPWRRKDSNGGTLTRREDFFPTMSRVRDEFDALFDRFFGRFPLPFESWSSWGWGLDLDDRGNAVVVRAEAPGFEASDFDVQISGNVLTIRAEHKQESKGEEGDYFSRRQLHRSVTLPAGTDTEKVEATYRNGILELRLPKTPEAQAKRIEVKT